MKLLPTILALLFLLPLSVRADERWRFMLLADWHAAEVYVQPNLFPGMAEENLAALKMLHKNYGGELVMLPGDSNRGHWDTPQFIKSFNPDLTPTILESIPR